MSQLRGIRALVVTVLAMNVVAAIVTLMSLVVKALGS